MNHSHQRDLIINYLKSTKSHPTAEAIYREVQKVEPDISLGTVYRNLKLLTDNQMILKLHMQNGIDHYDADISNHYHFYCKKCEQVFDFEINIAEKIEPILKSVNNNSDFLIEGCNLIYHGICSSCSEQFK